MARIEPDGADWRLETAQGPIRAENVIVATGYNGAPFIPAWPGREGFAGELIHSSQYLNPAPFRDRDVLVVGAGNSGAEIAHDVIDGGAKRSRLSVRTPPQIVRRATAGIPAQLIGMAIKHTPPHWVDPISKAQRKLSIPDLAAQGLPRPEQGIRSSFIATGTTPILDVGIVNAVRRGRVEVVAAVEGFDGADVLLADGSRIQPDAIIAATGFRTGLDELVGHLGVLTPRGLPTTDRRGTGASRPLVCRLHADARRPASRGQHRRAQGGRGHHPVVGTDRFELSASASQTQRSNQAELRPVSGSVGVGFAVAWGRRRV